MNSRKSPRPLLAACFLILLSALLPCSPALAEDQNLPDPAKIFSRYIDGTGGRAAWDRIDNRVVKSLLTIPDHGIEISMTIYSAQPNRSYTILESEMTGKIEKGSDGETVWEKSLMTGAVVKTGKERSDYLRESHINKYLDWQELYEKAVTVGAGEVDGLATWIVNVTPADAADQQLEFDQESGLLVALNMVSESPAGEVPIKARFHDYRDVSGVLVPFKISMLAMNQERVITINSIECNIDLPEGVFEPPPEVKALAK